MWTNKAECITDTLTEQLERWSEWLQVMTISGWAKNPTGILALEKNNLLLNSLLSWNLNLSKLDLWDLFSGKWLTLQLAKSYSKSNTD